MSTASVERADSSAPEHEVDVQPGRNLRALGIGLLLAVVYLGIIWLYFWKLRGLQYDDSFITYRYAENLISGRGLVFNEGEATNSASSFLYTVLLALLSLIPMVSIPSLGLTIGIAAVLVTIAAVIFLAVQLRLPLLAVVVAVVPFFAYPEFIYWSFSGMETLLSIAAMATFLSLFLVGEGRKGAPLWAFCLAAAVSVLVRPETVALVVPVLLAEVIVAFKTNSWRRAKWLAVSGLGSAAALFLFYWIYYGSPRSDAWAYKEIYPYYMQSLTEGLEKVAPFMVTHRWAFLISGLGLVAGLALQRYSRGSAVRVFTIPAVIAVAVLLTGLGPIADYNRYYWMLLSAPFIVGGTWGWGVVFQSVSRLAVNSAGWRPVAAIGASVMTFWVIGILFVQLPNMAVFTSGVAPGLEVQQARIDAGILLEKDSPPGSTVLSGDLGAIAFYNPSNKYLDQGLVTPSLVESINETGDAVTPIIEANPQYVADTIVMAETQVPTALRVFSSPPEFFGAIANPSCPFEELASFEPIAVFPAGTFGVSVGRLEWKATACP